MYINALQYDHLQDAIVPISDQNISLFLPEITHIISHELWHVTWLDTDVYNLVLLEKTVESVRLDEEIKGFLTTYKQHLTWSETADMMQGISAHLEYITLPEELYVRIKGLKIYMATVGLSTDDLPHLVQQVKDNDPTIYPAAYDFELLLMLFQNHLDQLTSLLDELVINPLESGVEQLV